MKDRIRQLMEVQRLTQQNFADMLQISPASLSSIFNDRTKPTLNHVEAIHKAFPNINLQWLLYGDGEMFVGNNTPESAPQKVSFSSAPSQDSGSLFDSASSPIPLTDPLVNSAPQSRTQKTQDIQAVKIIDKEPRRISEIRIFYDDQTWETFVPKK